MSEKKIQWRLLPRRQERDRKKLVLVSAINHPLQSVGDVVLSKEYVGDKTAKESVLTKKKSFVDPLSSLLEGSDPLSSFVAKEEDEDALSNSSVGVKAKKSLQGSGCKSVDDLSPVDGTSSVSWENSLSQLRKFSTKQKLSLTSSFLSSTEPGVVKVQNNIPDRTKLTSQSSSERVKARLEQLDSLDEGIGGGRDGGGRDSGVREVGGLSQEQFTSHLSGLKEEMNQSWKEEQRVKALKITIQCVKSLSLSPPEAFYPCKFSLISSLLDDIGSLVYSRLEHLVKASSPSSVHLVPKYEAEETARNWFYKVTSIRDLLPRIYLEAALMSCYSVLPAEESKGTVKRLLLMCRGLGDPLVGAYVRMYILHMGADKGGRKRGHDDIDTSLVMLAIEDLIRSCKWGWNGNGIEEIESLCGDEDGERESGSVVAERVFSPPFKWLLMCLPKTVNAFKRILCVAETSKGVIEFVLVKSILETFPVSLVSPHCLDLLRCLEHCFDCGECPQDLLFSLASSSIDVAPLPDQRLSILNSAWILIVRLREIHKYLKAAAAWLRFTGIYYTCTEMEKVVDDALKRVSKFSSTSEATSFYQPLLHFLVTALSCNPSSHELYTFSSFRGLLSLFQRETGSSVGMTNNVGEMKTLLEAALQYHRGDFTNPSVVQLLLSLFSSLHDGINAMTTQDERRQICHSVLWFVRRVHFASEFDFASDFELQLEFYVDARHAFSNLDSVLESLIQHVLRLQVSTLQGVTGGPDTPAQVVKSGGKKAGFARACTAFCFITIPSLSCPVMKLKLYLLCGSIAMVNNCMGQGDACIKSAIKIILEFGSYFSPPNLPLPSSSSTPSLSSSSIPHSSSFPSSSSSSSPSPSSILSSIMATISSYLVAIPDPPHASRSLYLFRGLSNSLQSLSGVVESVPFIKVHLALLKGVCASAQPALPYHFKNVDGNDVLYGGEEEMRIEAESICTEILASIITLLKEIINISDAQQVNILCDLLDTILCYGDIAEPQLGSFALNLHTLVTKQASRTSLKNVKDMFEERTREAALRRAQLAT